MEVLVQSDFAIDQRIISTIASTKKNTSMQSRHITAILDFLPLKITKIASIPTTMKTIPLNAPIIFCAVSVVYPRETKVNMERHCFFVFWRSIGKNNVFDFKKIWI